VAQGTCRILRQVRVLRFSSQLPLNAIVGPNYGGTGMGEHGAICRLGVFYDGSFFSYAQNHYYHERQLGWLRFSELHRFLEKYIGLREQGFANYKVVYAAWHQGLFTSKNATADQLKRDRDRYHDLMHAGVDPKYLPMSQKHGEKGVDVALAVDALQVGLGHMIDVAVLVTGDGDFVPLVRALNKQGVRVLAAYFAFEIKDGSKSFINERLLAAANYAVDIDALGSSKEHKQDFTTLFRKA
jgi:NYN domain